LGRLRKIPLELVKALVAGRPVARLQATFAPNCLTAKTKADAELKKGQAPG
jgi:hypothetical protein